MLNIHRMTHLVGKRIEQLRETLGESQEEFAARFDRAQATISRWETGQSYPKRRDQEAIAELAGMTVAEFFYRDEVDGSRAVPISGYVSDSETFIPLDDDSGEGLEVLKVNLDAVEHVAARIRGDAMAPAYRNGDTIVGMRLSARDVSSAIGKDCIVMGKDGRGYVKRLLKGSRKGLYRLRSYSMAHEDIEIAVDWVAPIIMIRRSAT